MLRRKELAVSVQTAVHSAYHSHAAWRRAYSSFELRMYRFCVIRVPVCARLSRVCPGSPR